MASPQQDPRAFKRRRLNNRETPILTQIFRRTQRGEEKAEERFYNPNQNPDLRREVRLGMRKQIGRLHGKHASFLDVDKHED